MKKTQISRRRFLYQGSCFTAASFLPFSIKALSREKISKLNFGLIADPHADLIPDKHERLEAFVSKAIEKEVDFILQLGDFCFPLPENKTFMSIWEQFKGPKYHVLGNHDMDVSSKEATRDYWGMTANYYSFDHGDFHFIILDANHLRVDGKYLDYDTANFYVSSDQRTFIDPAQIEWLKADLQSTKKQTIVFSHQSLINALWGIKNRVAIQQILEAENKKAGYQKVIACFNGHDHIDFHRQLNGIHYIELNSASYQWLGEKYSNKSRYPEAFYKDYPHLDKIAPYKDALFSFIELDPTKGLLQLQGLESEWLGPSPKEIGVPDQVTGNEYSPGIKTKVLSF